jgi:hypothetical protein
MPSNLLALPFRPVINQNGTFESGAVMTVYKSGGSTLEPIFANFQKTIPLTNPLTANGFGVFPPVYYSDTQPVRVVIVESNGTTLFDVDPYISTVFEAEAILDQAQDQVTVAAASASAALASQAACSAIEGTVQALAGPAYVSTAAGISATVNGAFFAVVVGDVITIYLNSAGTAVSQRSILSATATTTALAGKAATVHTHVISDVTGLQTAIDAKAPLVSSALTGTPTVNNIEIGFRNIPRRTTTTTSVVDDRGGCVAISANFTIPNAVFAAGDAISIYNNSGSTITILQGSGLTLRQAATANTGNRSFAQRGMATIWFNSSSEAIISGPGIT